MLKFLNFPRSLFKDRLPFLSSSLLLLLYYYKLHYRYLYTESLSFQAPMYLLAVLLLLALSLTVSTKDVLRRRAGHTGTPFTFVLNLRLTQA
jgi:hypothetical protein